MKNSIFISYSTQDQPKVKSIIERLRAEGLAGFSTNVDVLDPTSDVGSGDDIRSSILEGIKSSSSVVVIWSENALSSSWVNYELGIAHAMEKPTTVVVSEEGAPSIPWTLSRSKIVKLAK